LLNSAAIAPRPGKREALLNHPQRSGRLYLHPIVLLIWLFAPTLLATPLVSYEEVARYPHRSAAFTQGLELIGDTLYESSGLYHQSFVTRWQLDQPATIAPIQKIADQYFAEGLTVLGDKLYLLTWETGTGLVLNATTLEIERSFNYSGEGWGLTHNNRDLIMSDGTNRLRFINPQTLREEKSLAVYENGKPVTYLNELEWIDAGSLTAQPRLLANIWQTDSIVVIDPESGNVTARINLSTLYPRGQRRSSEDVLNGIAFDRSDNTLLVTGKKWRYLWRLKLQGTLP
jgi:glutamine cyclotransferase